MAHLFGLACWRGNLTRAFTSDWLTYMSVQYVALRLGLGLSLSDRNTSTILLQPWLIKIEPKKAINNWHFSTKHKMPLLKMCKTTTIFSVWMRSYSVKGRDLIPLMRKGAILVSRKVGMLIHGKYIYIIRDLIQPLHLKFVSSFFRWLHCFPLIRITDTTLG